MLLLVAAALALFWANSAWADRYRSLSGVTVGGLSLAAWADDGLLAIFFVDVYPDPA